MSSPMDRMKEAFGDPKYLYSSYGPRYCICDLEGFRHPQCREDHPMKFKALVGKTITKYKIGDDLVFTTDDGAEYNLAGDEDCCNDVSLHDVAGDFDDMLHTPILLAEETENVDLPALDTFEESHTWTFYTLRTKNGTVTIRFYGSSNGYYSEGASLTQTKPATKDILLPALRDMNSMTNIELRNLVMAHHQLDLIRDPKNIPGGKCIICKQEGL